MQTKDENYKIPPIGKRKADAELDKDGYYLASQKIERRSFFSDENIRTMRDTLSLNTIHRKIAIKKKLGSGHFGSVYEGCFDGTKVALKKVVMKSKSNLSYEKQLLLDYQATMWEFTCLSSVLSPHVLTCYGVYFDPQAREDAPPFLVLELCEKGDLATILKGKSISWFEKWKWALQIADGLAAIHEQGIVHRDIKASNVLVTADGDAKIADFGISKINQLLLRNDITPVVSSNLDILSPGGSVDEKALPKNDIFSLGLLFYHLLTGTLPTKADVANQQAVLLKYQQQSREGKLFTKLIEACWRESPDERPSAKIIHEELIAYAEMFHSRAPYFCILQELKKQYQSTIEEKLYYQPHEMTNENEDFDLNCASLEGNFLLQGPAGAGKTCALIKTGEERLRQISTELCDFDKEFNAVEVAWPFMINSSELQPWSDESLEQSFVKLKKKVAYNSVCSFIMTEQLFFCPMEEGPILVCAPDTLYYWNHKTLMHKVSLSKEDRIFFLKHFLVDELPRKLSFSQINMFQGYIPDLKNLNSYLEPKWRVLLDGADTLLKDKINDFSFNLASYLGLGKEDELGLAWRADKNNIPPFFHQSHERFRFLFLRPYSREHINTYLENRLGDDVAIAKPLIRKISYSFLSNPLFLHLLSNAFKKVHRTSSGVKMELTRIALYKDIRSTFISKLKLILSPALFDVLKSAHESLEDSFDNYIKKLISLLLKRNQLSLEINEAVRLIDSPWCNLKNIFMRDAENSFEIESSSLQREDYLHVKRKQLDIILQESPIKERVNQYEFFHKSYFDFLLAEFLSDSIIELAKKSSNRDDFKEAFCAFLQEHHFKKVMDGDFFYFWNEIWHNKKNTFIEFAEDLFSILKEKKETIGHEIQSIIASLLAAAKIPFSGQDLSQVKISGAHLSKTIIDGTNFQGADLSRVNLSSSYIDNCSFVDSNLEGLIIHSSPKISDTVESSVGLVCYPSQNNKDENLYVILGTKKGEIHYHEKENSSNGVLRYAGQLCTDDTGTVSFLNYSYRYELLTASTSKKAWAWDAHRFDKKWQFSIPCERGEILAVGVTKDIEYVFGVDGGHPFNVAIWNPKTKECDELVGHKNPIVTLSISNTNKGMWVFSFAKNELFIWEATVFGSDGGKQGCTFSYSTELDYELDGIEISHILCPDDFSSNRLPKFYFLTKDNNLYECQQIDDDEKEFIVNKFSYSNILKIDYDIDQDILFTAHKDCKIRIWRRGEEVNIVKTKNKISNIRYDSIKQELVATDANRIYNWELSHLLDCSCTTNYPEIIKGFFPFNNHKLVFDYSFGRVGLWSYLEGDKIEYFDYKNNLYPDKKISAINSYSHYLIFHIEKIGFSIVDTEKKELVKFITYPEEFSKSFYFEPDKLVLSNQDTFTVIDLISSTPVKVNAAAILTFLYLKKQLFFIKVYNDYNVLISRADGGENICLTGHLGPVLAIAACEEGVIATSSSDRSVRIWSLYSHKQLHILSDVLLQTPSLLAYNGEQCLAVISQGNVILLSTISGKALFKIKELSTQVSAITFCSPLIMALYADNVIYVFARASDGLRNSSWLLINRLYLDALFELSIKKIWIEGAKISENELNQIKSESKLVVEEGVPTKSYHTWWISQSSFWNKKPASKAGKEIWDDSKNGMVHFGLGEQWNSQLT